MLNGWRNGRYEIQDIKSLYKNTQRKEFKYTFGEKTLLRRDTQTGKAPVWLFGSLFNQLHNAFIRCKCPTINTNIFPQK